MIGYQAEFVVKVHEVLAAASNKLVEYGHNQFGSLWFTLWNNNERNASIYLAFHITNLRNITQNILIQGSERSCLKAML